MADKKITCLQCSSRILAEWREAKWSAVYSFHCPTCATELQVKGAPPIRIHRMDAKGNWLFVEILGAPNR
jgi:hypothetical protein